MAVRNNIGLASTHFKNIDGLQIRFAKNEKKDGDPILLLSPWPESVYAFLPTWETFSDLGPVVAVDLPAFGRSQSRPDVRAPEAMGQFVPVSYTHLFSAGSVASNPPMAERFSWTK